MGLYVYCLWFRSFGTRSYIHSSRTQWQEREHWDSRTDSLSPAPQQHGPSIHGRGLHHALNPNLVVQIFLGHPWRAIVGWAYSGHFPAPYGTGIPVPVLLSVVGTSMRELLCKQRQTWSWGQHQGRESSKEPSAWMRKADQVWWLEQRLDMAQWLPIYSVVLRQLRDQVRKSSVWIEGRIREVWTIILAA